jgi:GH15 family glucan-1,4-alpha-glucosidase
MPRSLVLGNGNMLATLDSHLQLRDFYYPYVGMEDHTAFGNVHRVGFYASGKFAWISDGSWQISIDYDTDTLVGKATAKNEHLQLSVLFEDFVYTTHNIFSENLP